MTFFLFMPWSWMLSSSLHQIQSFYLSIFDKERCLNLYYFLLFCVSLYNPQFCIKFPFLLTTSPLSFHRKAWQGTLCDLRLSLKQAVISIPPPLRREREWMLPRGIHILCHKANYIKLCRRVFADEFFFSDSFDPLSRSFSSNAF